ncbi:hypothetical protein [Hydrogenovibrio marinus]|uniref:Uncharacterized protein n=1 Tax=Hydrogenovibrio marinus TaxID=28885 RepID=A0A066ZSW2_HYDMR|nr:hypothetical protein [Hydrogenovibrio marinus]KDN96898.1 hypothetical protein EI16_11740 [Hydrogenovibrio marinus]BBN59157.1 hypothetical protein HVMH_0751 [Hydrogenovibrio marinus]
MSKTTLDPSLLEQLGIVNWRMHTQFARSPEAPVYESANQNQVAAVVKESPQPAYSALEEPVEQIVGDVVELEASEALQSENQSTTELVFVGVGLEQVWQNEESPAWRLMLNILNALEISEEDVLYFDTGLLHTEDAIWMTLEEIIDTGVEQVFSFDEDGMLNEALSEGLQVETLPSLDAMLMQGYAKKQGYYRLANYVR